MKLPFEDSRRLFGANLFFAAPGAVLEADDPAVDEQLIASWRSRIDRARAHLGWHPDAAVVRQHRGGASFALAASWDQLLTATEVNEWALCASLLERDPARWEGLEAELVARALEDGTEPQEAPALGEAAALSRLQKLASSERRPKLPALVAAAARHALPAILDDEQLTLGAGCGSAGFPPGELPNADEVPWHALHDIPTALVTGSNGKTTCVRLIAAMLAAEGLRCGYSSTDGVFADRECLASGDYSGPAGARAVLRDPRVESAVLETARGGILRRGIATTRASVALVTNISADHFGEYGIFDLQALADVKLSIGQVVPPEGLLILNADDALLVSKASRLSERFAHVPRIGWFALDAGIPLLHTHRAQGGATSGFSDGRLWVHHAGTSYELGTAADMPLSLGATVTYNMSNLAAAALAAISLGVPAPRVAQVLTSFGSEPRDNFGRLMQFHIGGARVLLDYAHNPDGLRNLLIVAERLRAGAGRLALILGHAGNRQDGELQALAQVAAQFRPELLVVKENEQHLRGRAPGEVPRILHAALLSAGVPERAMAICMSESEAARRALEWSQPQDVVVLPVHASSTREELVRWLEARSHQRADDGPLAP